MDLTIADVKNAVIEATGKTVTEVSIRKLIKEKLKLGIEYKIIGKSIYVVSQEARNRIVEYYKLKFGV